jgi:hypothetical protein
MRAVLLQEGAVLFLVIGEESSKRRKTKMKEEGRERD